MAKKTKNQSLKDLPALTGIEPVHQEVDAGIVVPTMDVTKIMAAASKALTGAIKDAEEEAAMTEEAIRKHRVAYLARKAFFEAQRQAYAGGIPSYRKLKDAYASLAASIDKGVEINGVKIPRAPDCSPVKVQLNVLAERISALELAMDEAVCEYYGITPTERDEILNTEAVGLRESEKEWREKHARAKQTADKR